jgi:thymidylate synthase
MKTITIGHDLLQKREIKKLVFESEDLPKVQLFNSHDVIAGNPASNVAIGFVYNWKADSPPPEIAGLFQRLSNYASLTGLWRTTNGGRYVFSNLLANPNINKLLLLVFDSKDNGHLLVDAVEGLWKRGVDKNGIIIGSDAANPKFEQVPIEGIARVRQQADLIVVRNIKRDFESIERLVKAMIQEPKNSVKLSDFKNLDLSFVSNIPEISAASVLYDDGARFELPYYIDLSESAKNVRFEERNLCSSIGKAIQAKNLDDAIDQIASFIFKSGSALVDMRNLDMIECRSISITVLDPLETIPKDFSEEYIKKYVDEFMHGVKSDSEFAYTYHERIFKRWGDQVEKIIKLLKEHPNTRRAVISLWDQFLDIGSNSPPCLDFIWICVRDRKLELHAAYRSHHLATVTRDGKLMRGEGAFVPNVYALGTLQKFIADSLDRDRGPLVITDFSGHIHVADV